jgi:asparagine synthetase A
MRAADYDDWVTETTEAAGKKLHGLNGDMTVSVWLKVLKEICAKENIYVLDTKK